MITTIVVRPYGQKSGGPPHESTVLTVVTRSTRLGVRESTTDTIVTTITVTVRLRVRRLTEDIYSRHHRPTRPFSGAGVRRMCIPTTTVTTV